MEPRIPFSPHVRNKEWARWSAATIGPSHKEERNERPSPLMVRRKCWKIMRKFDSVSNVVEPVDYHQSCDPVCSF